MLMLTCLLSSACDASKGSVEAQDASVTDDASPRDATTSASDSGDEGPPRAAACSANCTVQHPCLPDGGCECERADGDLDDDGVRATACGGKDQDDLDKARNPKLTEVCGDVATTDDTVEANWHDEDQNPRTFGKRDVDEDGSFDAECFNIEPRTGRRHGGDDCDDHDKEVHPGAKEICDGKDNDCDGLVDEDEDEVEGGLRFGYVLDADGDGYPAADAQTRSECPPGPYLHIQIREGMKPDLDDNDRTVHPDAIEICDGVDNDGDKAIDEIDDLWLPIEFPATDVVCRDGEIWIEHCPGDNDELLWCPEYFKCRDEAEWCPEKYQRGCDVDGTRRSTCRACSTDCKLSCGRAGCDEVEKFSVGFEHVCVRTTEGNVACWGLGESGRLGLGTTAPTLVPTKVLGLGDVKLVTLGWSHTCAVAGEASAVYCWGSHRDGRLGTVDIEVGESTSLPTRVYAGEFAYVSPDTFPTYLEDIIAMDTWGARTCALNGEGYLGCWGLIRPAIAAAQEGDDEIQALDPEPTLILDLPSEFQEVELGENHGCLLSESGEVSCWGDNTEGQLGTDPTTLEGSEEPRPVPGLGAVTAIDAAANHTCVITKGQVYCWGRDIHHVLGRSEDDPNPHYLAQPVRGPKDVVELSVADTHVCALANGGRVWCWGYNGDGQQAEAQSEIDTAPHVVEALQSGVKHIATGRANSCAVSADDVALCWGRNSVGQVGNGAASSLLLPITAPSRVSALAGSLP